MHLVSHGVLHGWQQVCRREALELWQGVTWPSWEQCTCSRRPPAAHRTMFGQVRIYAAALYVSKKALQLHTITCFAFSATFSYACLNGGPVAHVMCCACEVLTRSKGLRGKKRCRWGPL